MSSRGAHRIDRAALTVAWVRGAMPAALGGVAVGLALFMLYAALLGEYAAAGVLAGYAWSVACLAYQQRVIGQLRAIMVRMADERSRRGSPPQIQL